MIFQTVDVSKLGPFAAEQRIDLSRMGALIEGPPGSGKTTIAAELTRVFKSDYTHETIPLHHALSLSFIGADYSLRKLSGLDCPLNSCLETSSSGFSDALSSHINRLMHSKIYSGRSKFGKPGQQNLPLAASISPDGHFSVRDNCGSDMRYYFLALSEQFVLSLAANLAVRDTLGFCEPIVVDGAFDMLDELLLPSCFESIMWRSEQRVILSSEYTFNRVPVRPDFRLILNADGQCTIESQRA